METNPGELPVLIGQQGPLNGQRWQVGKPILIGRDAGCDVIVVDRQISRFHARLSPTARGTLLEDLGSKNGTYINGKLLEEPCILQDGDQVQVALVQHFTYLSSDATMPLEGMLTPPGQVPSPLRLDPRSRRVWVGSEEIVPPLSAPQFRLLQVLYNHPNQVVSRMELVEAIWSDDEAGGVSEQALDALIRRLRDRLALLDPEHNWIVTVRGHGLRLDLSE
ncbi:MAG TPA: FHA domain-containing protein [Anaerolineaceae bacterium]|jgi:hypothetical protein|nr:FHA domain-containing protein [Anaerolineaceae bacterium]NMD32228.1 FHA domain-containing protein [Chloroflexota bacterium]HNS64502.1 FHA domain-containing protein [Anaerolineaceae bacterium]HNZ01166.1 FHA domain-containing protein [Anaerolineaceae bacterium]HOD43527.1 FHA domain-containing protein [Anaerolineaceae bacterium]